MSHAATVHVTVVATNAAGLSRVFYSQPVTVDFTPPQICCIMVCIICIGIQTYIEAYCENQYLASLHLLGDLAH